jgi:hypothetical protein
MAVIPLAMALTVGMTFNNVWALIEGLRTDGGEFVRTPKFGILSRSDRWAGRSYASARRIWVAWMELAAFAGFLALGGWCVHNKLWLALPFLALFLTGFGYVTRLSWSGALCDWMGWDCAKGSPPVAAPADPARQTGQS